MKNIGQNELAKNVNTTLKTISHWETGYCEPSIAQLIALADYFEISLDELVDRK
ncbi:MAG: helix-turn-helix transcriptional regulator [Clostridia bacterium]|nr:helix-turn-helix transcriptional regulator [Clostridia bacterium]